MRYLSIKNTDPNELSSLFITEKSTFPAIRGLNLFSLSFRKKSFSISAHFELQSILTLTAFLFLGIRVDLRLPSFVQNVNS